jgi:lipopolysaccharide transport system ATP-binding protein
MSDIAIRVAGLSKHYQIYSNPRDRLKQFVLPTILSLFNQPPRQYFKEFVALSDVSFEVKKGETVGIIGKNGSGKSTLLQLICGTLNQTHGAIETNGRVAALLELGSGFNPEFTGRENVYLNAAVLGLTKKEVDARFDDIAAFADIGLFIEQPIKTYSSGMMVRLAFSVAINVEPEILIVDEALSVGDELFSRKCFSRIEAIRSNGATILFVSHSGAQIVELCDKAILLDAGQKLAIGKPRNMVALYHKLLYAPADKKQLIRDEIINENNGLSDNHNVNPVISFIQDRHHFKQNNVTGEMFDPHLKPQSTISYESNGATIYDAKILTLEGEQVNHLLSGKDYVYSYRVNFNMNVKNVRFGLLIKTVSGVELGGGASAISQINTISRIEANTEYMVEFKFSCKLNSGVYFMNAGVLGLTSQQQEEVFLHRLIDIAMFRVIYDPDTQSTGIVDFAIQAKLAPLGATIED